MEGKAVKLRRNGKEKQMMKSDVITEEEEELLWRNGALGNKDAKTLNKVLYVLSQHFGTRGRQEHHDIKVEELRMVKSPTGVTDYIHWTKGLEQEKRFEYKYASSKSRAENVCSRWTSMPSSAP